MILILSETNEPNTSSVIDHLIDMNKKFVRVDGETIPDSTQFELVSDEGGSIKNPFTEINGLCLDTISSVWYRRTGFFSPQTQYSKNEKSFVFNECKTVYDCLPMLTSKARWMNDIYSQRKANNPIWQLVVARSVGLKCPEWVITQDPKVAREFYYKSEIGVVTKVIQKNPIAAYDLDMIFTSEVHEQDLQSFDAVSLVPTLFQEKINKSLELRVIVVGTDVFAATTERLDNKSLDVDLRANDVLSLDYYPYLLPQGTREKILTLMERLDLIYGALDLIVDENGEIFFLEVNPGGQWGWIEGKTGHQISRAIANWL